MNTRPFSGEHPGAQLVNLGLIDVADRLRSVDMDYAEFLAQSFAEVGQLQPIEIRPAKGDRFRLVSGAHRYTAAQINKWDEILVIIKKSTDIEAEIREIDENLFRHELNALDRAAHLARRQELYLQQNPDAAQGKAGASARWHATANLSFASDAAKKLGISDRDVRRTIARFTKIAPDVRAAIAGTWVSRKAAELDELVKLGPQEQRQALKALLREEAPAKSVRAAVRELHPEVDLERDVDAEQLARLQKDWSATGAKAKAQFLDWLDASKDNAFHAWRGKRASKVAAKTEAA